MQLNSVKTFLYKFLAFVSCALKTRAAAYLASSEYINTMPMSITELVLSYNSMSVSAINRQLRLSAAEVHPQQRISALHLQYDEVLPITLRQFGDRSLVENKSIILGGHELQACVAVSALAERLKPCPAVPSEAVLCLLAARSVEALRTHASSTHNTQITSIHTCLLLR